MKGNTQQQPRFPELLHQLLKDAEAHGDEHIVSWLPCGRRFKVHNTSIFAKVIMPRYFDHNLYKSFLRQLSLYEFRRGSWKSSPGPKGSYEHPFFQKDRPDLFCRVIRVKNKKVNKSAWILSDGGDDQEIQCESLASENHSLLSARRKKNTNSEEVLLGMSDPYLKIFETRPCSLPEDIVQEIIQTFATDDSSNE